MDQQKLTSGEHVVPALVVQKYGAVVPFSSDAAADMVDLSRAFTEYLNASPEQRAEWERQAADRRRAEREATQPVALTLDAVLDKLGWTREYAEHAVQPYCTCGDGPDGWDRCTHASDLGV